MNNPNSIRCGGKYKTFLALLLCGLVYCLAGCESTSVRQTASSGGFRFKDINDKSVGLWEGEQPVFVYNHGLISKPEIPRAQDRSSYLHPIYGLDGEILTDDFPADHLHHHGLFWAWPHIKIGDKEYDLWIEDGIRIKFQRWLTQEAQSGMAILGVENGWFTADGKVMNEKVWFKAHPATSKGRFIDVTMTWTATDRPVTLEGAEGKSYGGMTVRFKPDVKTVITVPDGVTSEDLLLTHLEWVDFSSGMKGTDELSGASIFVHPSHPGYPPTWVVRHYGMVALGWPGVTAHTFQPGESFTCRYRLWIHRGSPQTAEIQVTYDEYISSVKD